MADYEKETFSFTNKKIQNRSSMQSDDKTKDIELKFKEGGHSIKIHSAVITKEFKTLYDLKESKIKEYTITKKVRPESLQVLIDYMYNGKLTEIKIASLIEISGLCDMLGNKDLFSKLSDFLFDLTEKSNKLKKKDNEEDEINKKGIVSTFKSLSFFSMMFLMIVYMFYKQISEKIQMGNSDSLAYIESLEASYSKLKELSKSMKNNKDFTDAGTTEIKHNFKEENDQLLLNFQSRIEALEKKLEAFKTESIPLILKKANKDFAGEIAKKQVIANDKYLAKAKKEFTEKNKLNFDYYYSYNQTEIGEMMSYVNKTISSNMVDNIAENITVANDEIAKVLPVVGSELQKVTKQIESFKQKIEKLTDSKQKLVKTVQERSDQLLKHDKNLSKKDQLVEFVKELRRVKDEIKGKISVHLSLNFEYRKYYEALSKHFGKNFNSKLLYSSNRYSDYNTTIDVISSNVLGKRNLLIMLHTNEDKIVGGFSSIRYPQSREEIGEEKFHNYDDPDAFIYEFYAKGNLFDIHDGVKYARFHVSFYATAKTFSIGLGPIRSEEGLKLMFFTADDKDSFFKGSWGKPSRAYKIIEGEFDSINKIQKDHALKSVKIFELEFLESN